MLFGLKRQDSYTNNHAHQKDFLKMTPGLENDWETLFCTIVER
jgi:hypothetical protein